MARSQTRAVRGAGRPQPTLCKHGGEAEPAARADKGFASLRSQ